MFTKYRPNGSEQNVYVFQGPATEGGIMENALKHAKAKGYKFQYKRVAIPLKAVFEITVEPEELKRLQEYVVDYMNPTS
ncbi:hypothetical protein LUCX_208 [Xanthomonas phage vB_XciM_LucasX]|nr:hypothetical protein LUCX_208 [Xanthomonas phage vB_XciM_LucasX]